MRKKVKKAVSRINLNGLDAARKRIFAFIRAKTRETFAEVKAVKVAAIPAKAQAILSVVKSQGFGCYEVKVLALLAACGFIPQSAAVKDETASDDRFKSWQLRFCAYVETFDANARVVVGVPNAGGENNQAIDTGGDLVGVSTRKDKIRAGTDAEIKDFVKALTDRAIRKYFPLA